MTTETTKAAHGNLCQREPEGDGFATAAQQKKLRGLPILLRDWGTRHMQTVRNQHTERNLPIFHSEK